MRNPRKSLFVVAPAALDPFGEFGNRAARRHPRRDPEGHPQSTPPANPATPSADPATPPAATPPAATPPAAPAQDDWATTFEGKTPAEVKAALDESRKWESRAKANHPKAQKYDQFLAGLTGVDPATPPDPAKLSTDLTAAQRGEREARVENAILRIAPDQKANANSLIDSRTFMAKLDALDLDPAAPDFTEKLTAEITDFVTANPSLKVTAPVPVGAFVPHEGNQPPPAVAIDEQIAAAQSKGDFTTAMQLKAQKFAAAQTKK